MENKTAATLLCAGVFLLSLGASLLFGAANISLSDVFGSDETVRSILISIRLPRTLVAALCGAALAAAGVLSQGLFRNSLASPSILGTTAGASAAASAVFYFGVQSAAWFTVPVASVAGAFATTIFILYVAGLRRLYSLEQLLLAGFAVNAFLSAITSLVVSLVLEDYQKFSALMYWLLGGLNARGWEHFQSGLVPTLVGLVLAYVLAAKLNVLALGEEVAQTLSIDMRKLKLQTVATISLLVGTAVSIAGAITFVGLIVPHLTRLLVGAEHKRLLVLSTINGMSLVMLADLVARTARPPTELQVGVIIALLGAPFFFWLLCKKDSQWN